MTAGVPTVGNVHEIVAPQWGPAWKADDRRRRYPWTGMVVTAGPQWGPAWKAGDRSAADVQDVLKTSEAAMGTGLEGR